MPENLLGRPMAYHIMVKPIGPICNLDCRYCFYLEKDQLYSSAHSWAMPDAVLESFVRQYIESQDIPVIQFAWQGGEPTLLGIDFFQRTVDYQKKYANGKHIENAMQTNGILVDDGWGEFLAQNHFLVGLSIDGPEQIHDHYRVDKGGQPTFARVMEGLRTLRRHGVEFNTLTCVQRHNARKPLEVYRFLKAEGSGFMQFIPVVERIASEEPPDKLSLVSPSYAQDAMVAEWSVDPHDYGSFLCAIFDEWVRNDVGQHFVQAFDIALEAWVGMMPSLCVYSETCGAAMALEHNGDLYSCDHYVYPDNFLGNLMEIPIETMVCSGMQQKFGEAKSKSLPQYCRDCRFHFACHGECPKHRFRQAPTGEGGLNYLCPGLKQYFAHIDPYMRFMAEELRHERPPANVMAWIRDGRSQPAGPHRIGRNDPCPCGSGRKYKKCCGAPLSSNQP